MRAQSQGHQTIDRLEEMVFVERTRKGHRRSDKHWKCFRGIMAKLSLREGVERIWVFPERVDVIVN